MLGKFPHEVEEIPCEEFDNILFYMQYKVDEQKKQMKKSSRKGGR